MTTEHYLKSIGHLIDCRAKLSDKATLQYLDELINILMDALRERCKEDCKDTQTENQKIVYVPTPISSPWDTYPRYTLDKLSPIENPYKVTCSVKG